ncbi:MAG: DUF4340 domain-containing protein, partial [Proteobacteria bacterium]|nr:DUF4340 domain-containing protein [Pseudomonadota bacterium]
PTRLFEFEKEDMVAVLIERPDSMGSNIEFVLEDGVWVAVGRHWRPSRSMVRRLAHQIHDLSSRARVAEGEFKPELYGLSDQAVRVTMTLGNGNKIAFEAGDPNPTGVSHYIRPLPGEVVFVVKKAAVDYLKLPIERFREDKFAVIDSKDADLVRAVVDGRELEVRRTGERTWVMSKPIVQDASREKVRMMLGRVGALKAMEFVEDAPEDFAPYGLDPPQHTIEISLSSKEKVTIWLGNVIEDSEPGQRYAYRLEDDSVYIVKDAMLEAYQEPIEEYRNRILIEGHEWDMVYLEVDYEGEKLKITRTSDDWRWPDESPVSGSTPKRVASRAAGLRAENFFEKPPANAGFEEPYATLTLGFADHSRTIVLGTRFEAEEEERRERQYAMLDEASLVYEVQGDLAEVVEDLFREYRRKVKRDTERNVPDL